MFGRTGKPEKAADDAAAVRRVETALAAPALERTQRRDSGNQDHKTAQGELLKLAPNLELDAFFAATPPRLRRSRLVPPRATR